MYRINLAGSPNSCVIKVGNQKFRSLVDSGAEVSLMKRKVYNSLPGKPVLEKKSIKLQSVSGQSLVVDGRIVLSIKLGKACVDHEFYVTPDMNRNVILGRDFLVQNGVRVYYDLGCMKVAGEYVGLEEDIHVASVVRSCNHITVKPQTKVMLRGRSKQEYAGVECQFVGTERSFLKQEPGLLTAEAIVRPGVRGDFPVLLVNTTNKTFRVKRGQVMGKVEAVKTTEIAAIEPARNVIPHPITGEEIRVPPEYRGVIEKLVK